MKDPERKMALCRYRLLIIGVKKTFRMVVRIDCVEQPFCELIATDYSLILSGKERQTFCIFRQTELLYT